MVRVYEFSKKTGLTNKEVLDLLKKGGFEVGSHMAALTDEAVSFLEKEVAKRSSKEKPKESKKELPKEIKKQQPEKAAQPKAAPLSKAPSQPKAPAAEPKAIAQPKVAVQPKAAEQPKVAKQPEVAEQPKIVEQPKLEQPKVVQQTTTASQPKPTQQPTAQQPKGAPQPKQEQSKLEQPRAVERTHPAPVPPAGKPAPKMMYPPVKEKFSYERPSVQPVEEKKAPTSIEVRAMTVEELALKLHKPTTEVIVTLLKKGVVAPKNLVLATNVIADVMRHFGIEPIFPTKKEKGEIVAEKKAALSTDKLAERMPVVVVMGHVDHGKTTLLDFIRKTRVTAKEKGGITQHLGAYEVDTAHGGIVFLDTPGHEAFSQIRMRGTRVADIAILVVAADDSVKPQTVEALKIARAMELPIVVAVNKIDKVDPQRVDVVKRDLAQYELLPEEWGGSTIFVPISAKVGTGVDQLLEIILLQSQMMELKANPTIAGIGTILESKLEKGRGPVATVICQEGTVRLGDFFVCGATQGKVNAMIDSLGRRVDLAGPSIPVQISGFEEIAGVGDVFEVVSEETYRTARASKGERRVLMPRSSSHENAINIIIKTDGNASREALLGALRGLPSKGDKEIYVVNSGVGAITESDVLLAANTGSVVVGLHVKAEANALTMAQRDAVEIKTFDIIYKLLEDLKEQIEQSRPTEFVKQKIGEAVVRKVFDIKGLGVIAGCYIKDGRVTRDASVVVWRGREKVGQGKIRSLQRDKKSVKEIQAGFECAFIVDGFTEWQEEDRVECFIEVPKA